MSSKYHCGVVELLMSASDCTKIGFFMHSVFWNAWKKISGNYVSMINKMLNNAWDLQEMTPKQRSWGCEVIQTDMLQMYKILFF